MILELDNQQFLSEITLRNQFIYQRKAMLELTLTWRGKGLQGWRWWLGSRRAVAFKAVPGSMLAML